MVIRLISSILPSPATLSVASLIADPWVMSLIPAQPHTFVEVDHEIFSTVFPFFLLIQEGLVLEAKVCARRTR